MESKVFKKIFIYVGVFVLALSLFVNPASARWNIFPLNRVNLVITSVFVDFTNSNIIINGHNFKNGRSPVVSLGEIPLTVQSYSDVEIVASLPETIEYGDYLLTVITGPAVKHFDSYALTISGENSEGTSGVSGYEQNTNRVINTVYSGTFLEVKADCSPGKKVLGGGGNIRNLYPGLVLMVHSGPYNGGSLTGWVVKWYNGNGSQIVLDVDVHAICADTQ